MCFLFFYLLFLFLWSWGEGAAQGTVAVPQPRDAPRGAGRRGAAAPAAHPALHLGGITLSTKTGGARHAAAETTESGEGLPEFLTRWDRRAGRGALERAEMLRNQKQKLN